MRLGLVLYSLFFLIVALLIIEVTTLNDTKYSDYESMYYLDSIKVSNYEDLHSIHVFSCSDGLKLKDGFLYMKNPNEYSEKSINQSIYGLKNNDTGALNFKLRSWKNDTYKLIEESKFHGGLISRQGKRISDVLMRKLGCLFYSFPLYTNKEFSIIANKGKLYKMSKGSDELLLVCDKFILEDPVYNMMLLHDSLSFIRTGYKIFFSKDNMKTWKMIYHGKRQVSESMFFRKDDLALIFTEYTPGNKLDRHHVITYNVRDSKLDTTMTFYSTPEHKKMGLVPFCRHIHVMKVDPYTGDVYMGVGDSDEESAIYRSTNGGVTFEKLGGGSQKWRTLTFMFEPNRIYWVMDSASSQYICGINRTSINNEKPLCDDNLDFIHPIINGALWNSIKIHDGFYLISCNSEGALYDNRHYVYGIQFNENPVIYNLISEKTIYQPWHQFFLLGMDCNGTIWTYDTGYRKVRKFLLNQ